MNSPLLMRPGCRIVAHRGRSGTSPENAIEALDELAAVVDGVEVDVRLSTDGVAVLMHDATVDRTTNGSGTVSDLSMEAIRGLQGANGAWVPTLRDYLDACAGRSLDPIMVDVKTQDRECLAETVAVVTASPVMDGCIVMVRSAEQMATVRELSTQVRLGGFGATVAGVDQQITAARQHEAEILLVAPGDEIYLNNRQVVATVQEAGLRSGASTINGQIALQAAIVDGCDVVLTDVTNPGRS